MSLVLLFSFLVFVTHLLEFSQCQVTDDCDEDGTICVDPTGYIQDAIDIASPTTKKILLKAGTYTQHISLNNDIGSALHPIELRPFQNDDVILESNFGLIFDISKGSWHVHSGEGSLTLLPIHDVTIVRVLMVPNFRMGPLEIEISQTFSVATFLITAFWSCNTDSVIFNEVKFNNPSTTNIYRAFELQSSDIEDPCGLATATSKKDYVVIKNCEFHLPTIVIHYVRCYGVTFSGNYIHADDYGYDNEDDGLLKFSGVQHDIMIENNVFRESNRNQFIMKMYIPELKYMSDDLGYVDRMYIQNNLFDCTNPGSWEVFWQDQIYTGTLFCSRRITWTDLRMINNMFLGDCTSSGSDMIITGRGFPNRITMCADINDHLIANNYKTQTGIGWAQSSWSESANTDVAGYDFWGTDARPIPWYKMNQTYLQGLYEATKSPVTDYEGYPRTTAAGEFIAGPFQDMKCPNDNYKGIDFCNSCWHKWVYASGCTNCEGNWDPNQNCNECINHFSTESDCTSCKNKWEGPACDTCRTNWDPLDDCNSCKGNRDNETDCATCLTHWEDDSDDCGTCPLNWDPLQNCDACYGLYDISTDCVDCLPSESCTKTCRNHWLLPSCAVCEDHWDPNQDCNACEFPWENEVSGCTICNARYNESDGCSSCINHYSLATYCSQCEGKYTLSSDCTLCAGNYEAASACTECINRYTKTSGCTECEMNFDPNSGCTECVNHFYGTDCTICPTNFRDGSGCADCIPGWTGDLCDVPICFGRGASDEKSCGPGGCVDPDQCECNSETLFGRLCDEYIGNARYVSFYQLHVDFVVKTSHLFARGEENHLFGEFACSSLIDEFIRSGNGSGVEDNVVCFFDGDTRETSTLVVQYGSDPVIDKENYDPLALINVHAITKPEDFTELEVVPFDPEEDLKNLEKQVLTYTLPIVAGVVLCALLCVCFLVIVLCCILKRRKKVKEFVEEVGGEEELRIISAQQKAERKDGKVLTLTLKDELYEIDYSEIKLKKLIGQGGSGGSVFLSTWQGQECVVKIFKLSVFENTEDFSEFQNEIEVALGVSHFNIVRFFGCTKKANRLGIVMEFCSKGSLQSYLRKIDLGIHKKLDVQAKLKIVFEIISPINYLHTKEIIHRDLKTENILLDKSFTCKLMDFGVSKVISKGGTRHSNQMTQRVGTSYYMAPEVFRGEQYTYQCDVFSFAICIWEVVNENTEPYGSTIPSQIEYKVANDDNFRPKIDSTKFVGIEWVEKVMKNCWRGKDNERPSSTEIVKLFTEKMGESLFRRNAFDSPGGGFKKARNITV